MSIEKLSNTENSNDKIPKNEKMISSASSDDVESGMKEARITFLENKITKEDTYENWLDLSRAINNDYNAQTDPEYKKRLEDLLKKSKWQEWSDRMNKRDDNKADLLLKLQELTGITNMKQNEDLLAEYRIDPVRFAAKLNALKSKN